MPTSSRPVGFHPRSVEWETVKFYHSTNNCVFVRFRVDVGIDPYIETVHAYHSSYSSISVRCGRLVAAPTGKPFARSFIVPDILIIPQ